MASQPALPAFWLQLPPWKPPTLNPRRFPPCQCTSQPNVCVTYALISLCTVSKDQGPRRRRRRRKEEEGGGKEGTHSHLPNYQPPHCRLLPPCYPSPLSPQIPHYGSPTPARTARILAAASALAAAHLTTSGAVSRRNYDWFIDDPDAQIASLHAAVAADAVRHELDAAAGAARLPKWHHPVGHKRFERYLEAVGFSLERGIVSGGSGKGAGAGAEAEAGRDGSGVGSAGGGSRGGSSGSDGSSDASSSSGQNGGSDRSNSWLIWGGRKRSRGEVEGVHHKLGTGGAASSCGEDGRAVSAAHVAKQLLERRQAAMEVFAAAGVTSGTGGTGDGDLLVTAESWAASPAWGMGDPAEADKKLVGQLRGIVQQEVRRKAVNHARAAAGLMRFGALPAVHYKMRAVYDKFISEGSGWWDAHAEAEGGAAGGAAANEGADVEAAAGTRNRSRACDRHHAGTPRTSRGGQPKPLAALGETCHGGGTHSENFKIDRRDEEVLQVLVKEEVKRVGEERLRAARHAREQQVRWARERAWLRGAWGEGVAGQYEEYVETGRIGGVDVWGAGGCGSDGAKGGGPASGGSAGVGDVGGRSGDRKGRQHRCCRHHQWQRQRFAAWRSSRRKRWQRLWPRVRRERWRWWQRCEKQQLV